MTSRQSDKELIRIIAMSFIVVWHIFLHGGTNSDMAGADFVRSITLTGVNLFVLISGWFGIRLNWRPVLNLYAMVFFYAVVSLLVAHFFLDYQIVTDNMVDLFFPMSRKMGIYWFISCYFMLMLFSPAINFFLQKSSTKQCLWLLFVLCYLSCFSGIVFNNNINLNGYNTFHLIFIYVLGYNLRRFDIPTKLKKKYWLGICFVSIIALSILLHFAPSKGVRYNNPLLILVAVSQFSYISSFRFKSSWVNSMAKFMLPIYLIQEGYCGLYAYKWLYDCGIQDGFKSGYFGAITIYLVGLLVITIIIESVRRKIMTPVIDLVVVWLTARIDIFR